MAKVTYKLRPTTTKHDYTIYMRFRFGRNIDYQYNTGLHITKTNWNPKTNRPRPSAPNSNIITNKLNQLETAITKYILDQQTSGTPLTPYNIKAFILSLSIPQKVKLTDFLDYIKDFATNAHTRTNPATGQPVSKRNIALYKRLYLRIEEHAKETKRAYTFKDIDLKYYNSFTDFLRLKYNYSTNSIGSLIKALKTILNEATIKGINTTLIYKSPKFKAVSEDSEQVYLTLKELDRIRNLTLTGTKDKVRDLFLIGAYTGLRFSDFSRIDETAIQGENIKIIQAKTGKGVTIPIHPIVSAIWYKYGGNLPTISIQKFNIHIKEIAQLAEIEEEITTHITKGGKRITETTPKYLLISSHTARRSFATNLYKSGYPALAIMQITGHKTEKAFLRYIKVTAEENAEALRKFWKQNTYFITEQKQIKENEKNTTNTQRKHPTA